MDADTSYYIGLMSGTSLDGVDVILADIQLPHKFTLMAAKTYPIPDKLKYELLSLSQKQQANELDLYAHLDVKMGRLFAQCCLSIMKDQKVSADQVFAIGSHGQTLRHYPVDEYPTTLQIGDPNIITQETQITTIADFRRRDIAAGGQGAPLVPPFHQALFSDKKNNRAILNIGGIANITFLSTDSSDEVIGYDTGPGNGLMDNWCNTHLNCAYDTAGELAAQGVIDQELLKQMLADPYFSQAHPKSTGREYFSIHWLEKQLKNNSNKNSSVNILVTLLELTCHSIANEIKQLKPKVNEVLVCGGGVKNDRLMLRLGKLLPEMLIASTEEFGLHPDWVEASAFAWLAKQTLNGLSSNLPSVTGANKEVILGAIWQA